MIFKQVDKKALKRTDRHVAKDVIAKTNRMKRVCNSFRKRKSGLFWIDGRIIRHQSVNSGVAVAPPTGKSSRTMARERAWPGNTSGSAKADRE